MTRPRTNVYMSAVRLHLLSALCCYSGTAFTATSPVNDPIACLSEDIRETFFQADYVISRETLDLLPTSLRKLEAPEGFRFVGSVTSSRYWRMGFITTFDVPVAEEKIVHALSGLGYKTPAIGEAPEQLGFRVQHRPRGQVNMCHPDHGSVLVRTRVHQMGTIVTATRYPQNDLVCIDQRLHDIYQGRFSPDFLPNLELPEDAQAQRGGGGGGSVHQAMSRVTFTSDKNLLDLLAFFRQQLAERGWRLDGQWNTKSTLGSIWSSFAEHGALRLVGLLEVSALDGTKYEVTMSVSLYD